MKKKLQEVCSLMNRVEEGFLIFGLSSMFVAMILQVFCRFVLNAPLTWTEVYARYMYMWVVFIGISYGCRERKHIYVSVVYDRIPGRAKKLLRLVLNMLIMYFFIRQIPWGVKYCQSLMRVRVNGISFLPRGIVYWCLPIGYSTAVIRLVFIGFELCNKIHHCEGDSGICEGNIEKHSGDHVYYRGCIDFFLYFDDRASAGNADEFVFG